MIKYLILFGLLNCFFYAKSQKAKFSIFISAVDSITANESEFCVEVRNTSKTPRKLAIEFEQGYLYSRSDKPNGELVIEVQRKDDNEFILLPPTADIDPIYYDKDSFFLQPGQLVTDTVHLSGSSWRKRRSKGFAAGEYRIRVLFNENEKKKQRLFPSNWIYFKLD